MLHAGASGRFGIPFLTAPSAAALHADSSYRQSEAVAPLTFIGSNGSNGDLRHVVLPGRVTVSFSGYEITHTGGRQFQRIGLQPHLPEAPTIAGLRAGKDEVLERALRLHVK